MRLRPGRESVQVKIIVKIYPGCGTALSELRLVLTRGSWNEPDFLKLEQIVDKVLTFSNFKSHILGSRWICLGPMSGPPHLIEC